MIRHLIAAILVVRVLTASPAILLSIAYQLVASDLVGQGDYDGGLAMDIRARRWTAIAEWITGRPLP